VTIQQLCNEAVLASQERGFHSPSPSELEKIALIMSELGEAVEELRKPNPPEYTVNGKPEGVLTELSDAVIRIADYCGYYGLDLQGCIQRKMAFNKTRPYKHGKTI